MAKKTKEEALQTRSNIINAARELFAKQGVQQTSLEQIAKVLGLTRGAIYWHFTDKKEILEAISSDSANSLQQRVLASQTANALKNNPLSFIEKYLSHTALDILSDPQTHQTFIIMGMMCEYTEDLSPILRRMDLCRIQHIAIFNEAYQFAKEQGLINKNLDTNALAKDTNIFLSGLCRLIVINVYTNKEEIQSLIKAHLMLRTIV